MVKGMIPFEGIFACKAATAGTGDMLPAAVRFMGAGERTINGRY